MNNTASQIQEVNNRTKWLLRISIAMLFLLLVIILYLFYSFVLRPAYNLPSIETPLLVESITGLLKVISDTITWQVTTLIVITVLLFSTNGKSALATISGRFRSIKAFGAEVEFTEEGARQLSITVEEAFNYYKKQADIEFQRQYEIYQIRSVLQTVLDTDLKQEIGDKLNSDQARCTIHVPDILFADTLYQLMDYYPKGTGAGRRFSTRYGIIGQAWRLGSSVGRGRAIDDKDDLISKWGMTKEEADKLAKAGARHSLLCAVLRDESGAKLAVVFVDAIDQDVFGDDREASELAEKLAECCKNRNLSEKLSEMLHDLRKLGTRISIQS